MNTEDATGINVDLVVDRMGGTSYVAGLCEIDPSAVSQWRKRKAIPRHWLKYLRGACPDAFLGEAESLGALPQPVEP